ncbi:ribonuclease H1-like [Phymastichus coffea]|uniref:ribonuclease H1-like n=1 Tax=Phymastichus coffea TaxID=108790 RepID=UPI00273B2418|nr:ribonuclease H1-like [Phymastichus coffea]XP_058800300.1 ribonuclease H1-like [Phymastichus coffea]XP_058800301.1 ribonuclease H1-like [Phymastichus coffea]XP_058800302.1 ribonuclease H1-like [Phymastichus coffea]
MGEFIVDTDGYTVVYTACFSNDANAGIGVWFGEGNLYNISQGMIKEAIDNYAEIQAITYAAKHANKARIRRLKIFTDSEFVIDCATKWIYTWKKNGWKTQDGRNVINKSELQTMEIELKPMNIKFVHVNSHQGNYGNQEAYRLARAGCEKYKPEYSSDSSSSDD